MGHRLGIAQSGLVPILLLFLPCFEIYLLHSMVHHVFGPNNVYLGFYSRDVYIPLMIGVAVCLDIMHRRRPFELRCDFLIAAINIFLFCCLATALVSWDSIVMKMGPAWPTAGLIVGAYLLVPTSFFVFLPWKGFLARLRPLTLHWLSLIASFGMLCFYPRILTALWVWLGPWTGAAVFHLLRAMGLNVTKVAVTYNIRVFHPDLIAAIGMGCSGYEGIFFFLFAYSLFRVFQSNQRSALRNAAVIGAGVLFLFALNILRIAGFFYFAVRQNQLSGNGGDFFLWAFHENLGWFLYFAGIWFFFSLLIRDGSTHQPLA